MRWINLSSIVFIISSIYESVAYQPKKDNSVIQPIQEVPSFEEKSTQSIRSQPQSQQNNSKPNQNNSSKAPRLQIILTILAVAWIFFSWHGLVQEFYSKYNKEKRLEECKFYL